MTSTARFLNPSEAARQLGVSAKALRLYEERGLLAPARTAAGWRAYDPGEMARFLVNAWEGATIRLRITQNRQPIDDFLNTAFKALLK